MATAATKTFKNLIGGEWVDAASGDTFETSVPATGETLGVFPRSGADDVDRAVDAAKAAYGTGGWSRPRAAARSCSAWASYLAEHKDRSALLMTREMGKVITETAGDVQEASTRLLRRRRGPPPVWPDVPAELPDKYA